ncbi:MAG: hypothetical protein Q8Q59_12395 [Luteolibacter sp.]|jgi:hypothetical protein|nr:hypothetical protein [Luteolibacter sp.]
MKRADHDIVQQVLDGEIDRESFDGFQQRLREEPELVGLYKDYALLHHSLSEEFEGGHSLAETEEIPVRRFFGFPMLLATAVALMVLAAALWWLRPHFPPSARQDVAVLTFSVDAVWRIEGASHNPGGATAVTSGAALSLLQGRAGIALGPAVTAVIEGPAELTIVAADALHLERGTGYFHRAGRGGGLTVTTPKLTAVDSGTEFGLETHPDRPDEIHVMSGNVRIVSEAGGETLDLTSGDAARVQESGRLQGFPSDGRHFPSGLGHFTSLVTGSFHKEEWRVEYGSPSFSEQRIEGVNYAAFLRLPEPEANVRVLLATLEVGRAADGEFHTDGWAGMSFFSKGYEVLFFGDSFGTKPTWSLDVKQRIPVILPEHPVVGPRAVTLRYDSRSGDVSLHDGGMPLGIPFCTGKLPAGSRFDEIRIGASAGACLAVKSLHVRAGGD